MSEAVALIDTAVTEQTPARNFAFANANTVNIACSNPQFKDVLNRMHAVFGDGVGIRIASMVSRTSVLDNVNGTDMLPYLCQLCREKEYSIYLLGAKPGVAVRMRENLEAEFPGLRIAGVRDGYFDRSTENSSVIAEINESGAEILLVAMGVPEQELWLEQNYDALKCPVRIAVGGLFDFYSGDIPRAPLWVRRMSVEWLYRLYQEPARLWTRYIIGNPLFLARVCRSVVAKRHDTRLSDCSGGNALSIFGVPISNVTMGDALGCIERAIDTAHQIRVFFVNTFYLNTAWENPEYRRVLKTGDYIFGDGTGVRIASRILRRPIVDNVNGTDMLPKLCEVSQTRQYRIFLLGAAPGIAAKTKSWMEQNYPGIKVVGYHHGYFDWEKDQHAIVRAINRSECDILLVGFSAPLQELWIQRHASRLHCKVLMGVGGLFDVYGGELHRPPMWLRKRGMEWVGRLFQEPRRLWYRYVVGNPLFLLRVMWWSRRSHSRSQISA